MLVLAVATEAVGGGSFIHKSAGGVSDSARVAASVGLVSSGMESGGKPRVASGVGVATANGGGILNGGGNAIAEATGGERGGGSTTTAFVVLVVLVEAGGEGGSKGMASRVSRPWD